MNEAERCDRISLMHAGRVLAVGTPHDLLTRPADNFVAALMSSPRRHADRLEALVAGPANGDTL